MSNPDPFEDAVAEFKARLTNKERDKFQITKFKDLQTEIEVIQKRQEAKREMRNFRRLESFLEAIKQFGTVVDLFANANTMVAFIWGPTKMILQIASSWTYAFDRILNGYQRLGESFPMLQQYIGLFQNHPELKKMLCLLYKDIFEFHVKALRFFTRSKWERAFRALWMDFNVTFENILGNLRQHRRLLHDQVQTLQMINTRENFGGIKDTLADLQNQQTATRVKLDSEEQQRRDESRHFILNWIAGGVGVAKDHQDHTFKSRFQDPNADSWILEHKTITDWLSKEPKTSFVWINGVPGAGKTVLASVIVEHCIKIPNAHIAYFFCKQDDPDTLTTTGILKALLMQQLCWKADLIPYFREQQRESGEHVLSSDRLTKSLFTLSCKGPERQYIIVDGIDECSTKQRANVLHCLRAVVNECDTDEPGSLRVLVVSRNEKDISNQLLNATELCLTDRQNLERHQKDIDKYVSKKAGEIRLKFGLNEMVCRREDVQIADIEDRMRLIALESKGLFLYAKLVMENLYNQNSLEDFFKEIKRDKLPKGLAEAYNRYERIIIRLQRNETQWSDACMLLGWMTCALRPLKWHEIQGIKSIGYETDEINFPLHKFRTDAVEMCGSLITVQGDRIGFMHSTASQFIAGSKHINYSVAQYNLTELCLRYLSFECFQPFPENSSPCPNDLQKHTYYVNNGYFAFADYAVSMWMQHLKNLCNPLPNRSAPEDCERQLQEVSEAAYEFFCRHLQDESARHGQSSIMLPDNAYTTAAKQIFEGTLNDGEQVQLLMRYITKFQNVSDGYKTIGILSLEKSFMRMRETVELLASSNTTARQGNGQLQEFYGSKLFKCSRPRCLFFHEGFTDKRTRDQHHRLHDRPFECEILTCTSNEFAFANKADLKRHVEEFHPDAEIKARLFNIPEKVKPPTGRYSCPTCGQKFTRRYILNDHMLSHAGLKPQECRYCGKGFTRKNDCTRHEKSQHLNRV